jgi:hypothetical protein
LHGGQKLRKRMMGRAGDGWPAKSISWCKAPSPFAKATAGREGLAQSKTLARRRMRPVIIGGGRPE